MNIILFGAPGSGKGTQAEVISQNLKLKHISLGDILREEVKKESGLGKEVKGYMDKGSLVPDRVVGKVIETRIKTAGFLLDGYPRNLAQAELLDQILAKNNSFIDKVLYLEVDEATIVSRLSKRRLCPACGRIYHLVNMPPKEEGVCDDCGAALIQRPDDTPEVIKKRWQVFLDTSQELLNYYKAKGKLIPVDARGEKDEVFERVKPSLK